MKKLAILFITLFSLLFAGVNAQSVDSLTAYADLQYAAGHYNMAAKEYQRALFFGPSESVGLLTIKTGDCFFNQGDFSEAEKYYTFASNIITEDSLRFEALSKKSVCLIRQRSYQQAILDLFTAEAGFSADAERQKAFLLGTCFYGSGEFSEAASYFHQALTESRSAYKDSITLLLQSKKLMRPDPNTAYWLSIFIPGSGQIYSGDVKSGINSAVLYAGFMALLLNMTYTSGWADAIFTVAPWWQRYYTGGYTNAKKIAYAKREANRAEIYRKIFNIIYP